MQYNEIYNICQPIVDWLKENYPHNHKIVIDTNGAEMIECGKLVVLDKDMKDSMDKFMKEMVNSSSRKETEQREY